MNGKIHFLKAVCKMIVYLTFTVCSHLYDRLKGNTSKCYNPYSITGNFYFPIYNLDIY